MACVREADEITAKLLKLGHWLSELESGSLVVALLALMDRLALVSLRS